MVCYNCENRLDGIFTAKSDNLTRVNYPNGTYTQYTYDPNRNWLVTLVNKEPNAAVLSSYSYTYDAVGNRLSVTEANDSNVSYAYDDIYQLTSETRTGTNAYSITYQYDDVGNRTQMVKDGNTTNYTYNSNNQLLTETTGGITVTYSYDGNQIIADYNESDVLQRKYVYGPGIDEPICMIAGGNTYYYHFDGLGSVTMLTDSGGQKVVGYRYDAFGTPTQTNYVASPPVNRFMFTGREYDNDSSAGLYYYRARYYRPSIGRFLQPDPIGYIGGINLYKYVDNNPINYVDPSGNFIAIWPIIRIGWGIGSGIITAINCHSCFKCFDSAFGPDGYDTRAKDMMDPCVYETWKRAAKPGAECIEPCTKCLSWGVSSMWGLWKLLPIRGPM